MKETLRAIKVGSYRSVFTILGISLSLISIFVLSNLLFVSFRVYREVWENVRFELFPEGDINGVIKGIKLIGGIDKVEIINGERARREFLIYYPSFRGIVDELGEDAFYTIVRVYPKTHWKDKEFLRLLYERISSLNGISGVYYGETWITSADIFFKTVLGLTLGVIFVTILANILISFYTVRFVVSHRKTYVDILRLAGVSPFKLRYPYMLLSMIYALFSWILSTAISLYLLDIFNLFKINLLENFVVFTVSLFAVILTCTFGAITALRDIETFSA